MLQGKIVLKLVFFKLFSLIYHYLPLATFQMNTWNTHVGSLVALERNIKCEPWIHYFKEISVSLIIWVNGKTICVWKGTKILALVLQASLALSAWLSLNYGGDVREVREEEQTAISLLSLYFSRDAIYHRLGSRLASASCRVLLSSRDRERVIAHTFGQWSHEHLKAILASVAKTPSVWLVGDDMLSSRDKGPNETKETCETLGLITEGSDWEKALDWKITGIHCWEN